MKKRIGVCLLILSVIFLFLAFFANTAEYSGKLAVSGGILLGLAVTLVLLR